MPKMKTHKASKKRFRVTATGKLKRSQAGKKHLNSHKTGKRKRQLRGKLVETGRLPRSTSSACWQHLMNIRGIRDTLIRAAWQN